MGGGFIFRDRNLFVALRGGRGRFVAFQPNDTMKTDIITTTTDDEGDTVLSVVVGDMVVFATIGDRVGVISFGLDSEVASGGADWMETMTGRGAFATIRVIRDCVVALVSKVESLGLDWAVRCDARRAKLYGRYLPADRITVI